MLRQNRLLIGWITSGREMYIYVYLVPGDEERERLEQARRFISTVVSRQFFGCTYSIDFNKGTIVCVCIQRLSEV